ncbi:MAG: DUF2157 domain-containing protein [Clostridia bacterium]|nr:DUF2157 domain-containing protein [Clostridia bacterium]
MTKVSKNLKKIRTSKNLTQEALAEKLFVTRQTVSGWENGRTQPDIEMLVKISEVLGVDVEEIIYGEKRFKNEEEKKQNTKRMLTVIFAVIASVLVAVGLILIFVTGWEKFPDILKYILAFVPILAGQAAAVYTYIKHRDSIAWREGASVLWCAGIAATVALVNSVFDVNGGFSNCLLIDALMFLPVIYVLDAVTPLAVYYVSTFVYCMYLFENQYKWIAPIAMLLFFVAGLVYVIINRKKTDDVRHIFSRWISVIAAYAVVFINGIVFTEIHETLFASLAFFLALYIADKHDSYISPFKIIGIAGCTVTSVVTVILSAASIGAYSSEEFDAVTFIFAVFGVVLLASALIIGKKSLKKNTLKIVYCSFAALCFVVEVICSCGFEDSVIVYILMLISALGMAVTLITHGALSGKFAPLNLGLVTTAVLIAYMIASLIEIGMLTAGILLLVFGVIMFTVNFLLARKMKPERKEEGGIICVKNQD